MVAENIAAPDENAIVVSGDRSRTRAELMDNARRAASGFVSLGIRQGDCVAMLLRNDIALLEVNLAAPMVGAYAVPINWHWKPAEIAYILEDSAAKVVVVHADLVPLLEGAPPGIEMLVVATPPEIAEAYNVEYLVKSPEGIDWSEWLDRQIPWSGEPAPMRENMMYTSGTTGRPKGVKRAPLTGEQARKMRANRALVNGFRPGIRIIVPGTLYHSGPNVFTLGALPYSDAVILMPKFDPEEFLRLVEKFRITTVFLVPTMMIRLLRLPKEIRNRYDVSSFEHIVHAGAPCPPEVKREMIEWVGPVLHEYYGATEIGPLTHSTSEEWLEKPGTVGRPTEGVELRFLDDEGREVPDGTPGEIFSRAPFQAPFTYNNRDEEHAAVVCDGFITAGDIGYLDEDGYLFLCDRKRDMIISAGVNIYPAEIEAALINVPGVIDCGVFGIPDAEFGETVCAALTVTPGTTEDSIVESLKTQLANFKVPRKFDFHETLPRDDSGKLLKRILRDPYWRDVNRAI